MDGLDGLALSSSNSAWALRIGSYRGETIQDVQPDLVPYASIRSLRGSCAYANMAQKGCAMAVGAVGGAVATGRLG